MGGVEASESSSRAPQELRCSRSDRVFGGVCGGLGRATGVDPLVYRTGFGVFTLLLVGAVLYGAAWLLFPDDEADASRVERLARRRVDASAGFALVTALVFLTAVAWLGHGILGVSAVAMTIVGSFVAVVARRRGLDLRTAVIAVPGRLRAPPTTPQAGTRPERRPWPARPEPSRDDGTAHDSHQRAAEEPPRATPPPSSGTPPAPRDRFDARTPIVAATLVPALLVAVTLAVLGAAGLVRNPVPAAFAGVTVAVGAGLLGATRYGHGRLLIVVGMTASLLLVGSLAAGQWSRPGVLGGGWGEEAWRPHGQVDHPFTHGAGEARLDLTALPSRGSYEFTARVGTGELRVRIPAGATVKVHASVELGSVFIEGRSEGEKTAVTATLRPPRGRKGPFIELRLTVGIGEVRVRRVSR